MPNKTHFTQELMKCFQVVFLLKYEQSAVSVQVHNLSVLSKEHSHTFFKASHIQQVSDDGTKSADKVFHMITVKILYLEVSKNKTVLSVETHTLASHILCSFICYSYE